MPSAGADQTRMSAQGRTCTARFNRSASQHSVTVQRRAADLMSVTYQATRGTARHPSSGNTSSSLAGWAPDWAAIAMAPWATSHLSTHHCTPDKPLTARSHLAGCAQSRAACRTHRVPRPEGHEQVLFSKVLMSRVCQFLPKPCRAFERPFLSFWRALRLRLFLAQHF
jgi:hypothetical protein